MVLPLDMATDLNQPLHLNPLAVSVAPSVSLARLISVYPGVTSKNHRWTTNSTAPRLTREISPSPGLNPDTLLSQDSYGDVVDSVSM